MLQHTMSPGGDVRLVVAPLGDLVPGSVSAVTIAEGVFRAKNVALISRVVFGTEYISSLRELTTPTLSIVGRHPLQESHSWIDGIYMRYLLHASSVGALLRPRDQNSVNENDVLHMNLGGRTRASMGGAGWVSNFFTEARTPNGIYACTPNLVVNTSEGTVTSVTAHSTVGVTGGLHLVAGCHSADIKSHFDNGEHDHPYKDQFYFLRSSWSGGLWFEVVDVSTGWSGDYKGTYTRRTVKVELHVDPIYPEVPEGTSIWSLAGAIQPSVVVSYSDAVTGQLYSGYQHGPSYGEIRSLCSQMLDEDGALPMNNSRNHTNLQVYLAALNGIAPNTVYADLLAYIGYNPYDGGFHYSTAYTHTFRDFESEVLQQLPQLVGGVYLSAVDALDQFEQGVSGNYIESASEIGSILDPYQLIQAIQALVDAGKRPTLRQILDLVGNAHLAYKFGVMPTLQDAKELASKIPEIVTELHDNLFREQTVYGKHWVALPDNTIPGFSNLSASLHTKVRLRLDPDFLLSSLLSLDQVGALPTLSRIWDLVPYSWLADYVLDFGGLLRLADKQVLMLVADVEWSTNSITVFHHFGDQGDWFNFQIAGQEKKDEPHYKVYTRLHLKGALPVLGPTSIPLFANDGLLALVRKWSTVGPVLLQKL